jgi:hypothetical protein
MKSMAAGVLMVLAAGLRAWCDERPLAVAVIDQGGAAEVCALLESQVAEDARWTLFGRDGQGLGAAIEEKKLQPLLETQDWAALCALTGVDALVLAGADGKDRIWARMVDISKATVLTETWFGRDPAQCDAQAGYLKGLLDRDRPKIMTGGDRLINLSLGSVASNRADILLALVEEPVRSRLQHRLANDPHVILNERRNLDNVVWERSLHPALETAPPTGRTALSVTLARQGTNLNARVTVLFPDGASREGSFAVALDPRDERELDYKPPRMSPDEDARLTALSEEIVTWLIRTVFGEDAEPRPAAFSPEAEAEYYDRQARFLIFCGMASQGAAAADAAWALGRRSPELLRRRIMAHAMLAFPVWNELQDWNHTRPRKSGRYGMTYHLQPIEEEPWRITAALRVAELMREYLDRYRDLEPEGFDDDPRILGARALYNALSVLMAAHELGLQEDPAHAHRLTELRELIAVSAEELLRMPITHASGALYDRLVAFTPLWTESLAKRLEFWDLYLESPQGMTWRTWARMPHYGVCDDLHLWQRGSPDSARPDGPPWLQRVWEKGNPAGMVFPWEPDALQRRKDLLREIVAMTRSADPRMVDKGWALWIVWWGNEVHVRKESRGSWDGDPRFKDHRFRNVSRFDHDFKGFDYIAEAKEAWGAPDDVEFDAWMETQQAAHVEAFKKRQATGAPSGGSSGAGPSAGGGEDLRVYESLLRNTMLRAWAQAQHKEEGFTPEMPDDLLYMPPASAVILERLTVGMKRPALPEPCSYLADGEAVYVLHLGKPGRVSRLDPPRNTLRAVDIPEHVQEGVDLTCGGIYSTYWPGIEPRWAGTSGVAIHMGERVSWLIGRERFAYRVGGDGEWRIETSPGGRPVLLRDRLYFLEWGSRRSIDLFEGAGAYGALHVFDPHAKTFACLFATRRFPARTILDAREPVTPLAVFAAADGALHVLVGENEETRWSVFRRTEGGDFERRGGLRCPRVRVGYVHACGGHVFLHIKNTASNKPCGYWNEWVQMDATAPGGLNPLWRDPRFTQAESFALPADIPAGTENGPYVRHGSRSYRLEAHGNHPGHFSRAPVDRRFQIEILDHETGMYYLRPLLFTFPGNPSDWIFEQMESPSLVATPDGLWINPPGLGSWYALVPYTDLSPIRTLDGE